MNLEEVERCFKSGEVVHYVRNRGVQLKLKACIVKIYAEAGVCNLSFVNDHPGLDKYSSAFFDDLELIEQEEIAPPFDFDTHLRKCIETIRDRGVNLVQFREMVAAQHAADIHVYGGDYVLARRNPDRCAKEDVILELQTHVIRVPPGGRGIVLGNSIYDRFEIQHELLLLMRCPI